MSFLGSSVISYMGGAQKKYFSIFTYLERKEIVSIICLRQVNKNYIHKTTKEYKRCENHSKIIASRSQGVFVSEVYSLQGTANNTSYLIGA